MQLIMSAKDKSDWKKSKLTSERVAFLQLSHIGLNSVLKLPQIQNRESLARIIKFSLVETFLSGPNILKAHFTWNRWYLKCRSSYSMFFFFWVAGTSRGRCKHVVLPCYVTISSIGISQIWNDFLFFLVLSTFSFFLFFMSLNFALGLY